MSGFNIKHDDQKKSLPLPPAFPILIYSGEKKWNAPLNFKDCFQHLFPLKYIPDFEYYLIAVNEIPDEKIENIKNAVSAVFTIEKLDSKQLLVEIKKIKEILKNEDKRTADFVINHMVSYFNHIKEYPLDIENLQNEEEVQTMLAAAIDRIKDEGIQEGELRKAREDALKMIQRNMSDDLIEDITGLSLSEIEELKN